MGAYAIGVDSGTQGVKVLIVDIESGRIAGRGRAPHARIEPLPPGASEQDPADWISALKAALGASLAEASGIERKSIVALGVSGQQHGFVPLDADGGVIRPAKLWNDTSTIVETAEIIRSLGGPDGVLEKTGLPLAVGYTASKILWLKKNEPERFRRLRTILLPHDYLNFVLTGVARMEPGDASGTGLLDVRRRTWSPEAVQAIDPELPARLPRLRPSSEPTGMLKKEWAAEFGLGDVLVSSGSGDNMMGAIGSGNVTPGVCTVSLGTSGTIYSYAATPLVDPRGEIAGFCDGTGGWLPLICTMNVTNVTEIWKSILGVDLEGRDALAAQAPAGADGLIFLPFVDGERVPVLPGASGVFFGLNRVNFESGRMTRAVMEGTLLNLNYGLGRLREMDVTPEEIRVVGGGSRSPFWLKLAADIFGLPVRTLAESEAGALGAAIQAIWSWGKARGGTTSVSELARNLVRVSEVAVEPEKAHRGVYVERQEKFNSLWKTLAPEFRSGR